MIQITNITKQFGKIRALAGVNAELRPGQITAVVGPNGSGKSTLIKCILGLIKPDSGFITVQGERVNGDPAYRKQIGYMPQAARFPENLTPREILLLIKGIRTLHSEQLEGLAAALSAETELDKPFKTLSGGTKQKISALVAFLTGAPVLILDEPTAGLDPVAGSKFKELVLASAKAGKTILLTSHIVSEIESLADHIVFLIDGKIFFSGSKDELHTKTGETSLERALASLMRGSESNV